ncbi:MULTISPECIES: GlxA family transcriptional regulator [Lentibacter]|jgi:transcriptional regulator GlxA family with amidase domain|uniref:Transcriptional regulator, AraC family with amidase-like domain n=1 Tax=Lentibacter algarum TaxID=576131 RepID=A0A1H3HB66_9RHOB|nr:GlxA family transcriptional regulator [Lentibacter algarum]MCO4826996.1 GlxA family transcriptional regulator [Lentibacter algarum]SDY12746.1 transcriptional regulator, AraC family with amidase-like domain [Lentibacter algarum]
MAISEKISPKAIDTAVLVLSDSNTLSFAAAVDPLRAANRRAGRTLFSWRFVTPTESAAKLTSGIEVQGLPLAALESCDLLIIVAGFNLDAHATPQLLAALRRLAPHAGQIAAIDGASWLLASAGLLDGQSATAHWEDLEHFATRFDAVETLPHRFVQSGKFATAGAAMPGLDMMLRLIEERFGARLAQEVAGAFLHDPSQPADLPQNPASRQSLARHHPAVARALALMQAHVETPLSIAALATQLSLSPRVLELRFKAALGQSPKATYLALRLSEAHRLALDTSLPVQDIALATGFASQASFARAFSKAHGRSLRALRQER